MYEASHVKSRGWVVVFAGMGINLALGVLYGWGAFQSYLVTHPYNWTATQSQIPYMVACLIFAVVMVPGGRLQDRIGPRPVIVAAGVLALVGWVLSGYIITPLGLSISFGIILGLAMGLGYAAPTPAALKWFGPHKRGIVTGVVVSGFGLAGIYVAPLARYLLTRYGLSQTFIILGIVYGIVIVVLAQFISNPPASFRPEGPPAKIAHRFAAKGKGGLVDWDWRQMVKTSQFYGLWGMFCIGTLSGLLIIGQLRSIGLEQARLSADLAYWLIGVYAFFNWFGRIIFGLLADKAGIKRVLIAIFVLQVAAFALFGTFTTAVSLFAGTALVAFVFGGMLTLFPAVTADYYGLKNLGINYGLLITAWGGGGVFGPLLGGIVRDATGTFNLSYTISASLSVVGLILAVTLRAPSVPVKSGRRSAQACVDPLGVLAASSPGADA